MIYVGVVGSRERNEQSDYQLVKQYILHFRREFKSITIVSGGADGIDTIAKKIADELHIPIIEHKPKYKEYPIKGNDIYGERNRLIAIDSNYLLAFPLNMSGGTMNTIYHFKTLGKNNKLKIVNKYDYTRL